MIESSRAHERDREMWQDEIARLTADLAAVTAERDAACTSSHKASTAFDAQYLELSRTRADRDAIRLALAQKTADLQRVVEAVERARAAMWDSYYGHGIALSYVQKVDKEISADLAATEVPNDQPRD